MYSRIVVGTDGSATAQKAINKAVEMAKLASARLHIVSAFRLPSARELAAERASLPDEFAWQVSSTGDVDTVLANAESQAKSAGLEVTTHAVPGEPADAIVGTAEAVAADLIIVGSKGMERRLMGSVPNTVSHKAAMDVLIVATT